MRVTPEKYQYFLNAIKGRKILRIEYSVLKIDFTLTKANNTEGGLKVFTSTTKV